MNVSQRRHAHFWDDHGGDGRSAGLLKAVRYDRKTPSLMQHSYNMYMYESNVLWGHAIEYVPTGHGT